MSADLLVKGAYTQSRLRQMIFGGATRQVICRRRYAGSARPLRLFLKDIRGGPAAKTPILNHFLNPGG